MIELAWSSSPKFFYKYIFTITQNDWPRVEFLAQNFLLVYIYNCTEWLSLLGVLRPNFFTSIYLLLHTEWLTSRRVPGPKVFYWWIFILIQNDWACLEFFAQTFLLVMNINIQVERNCSPKNFYQYNSHK